MDDLRSCERCRGVPFVGLVLVGLVYIAEKGRACFGSWSELNTTTTITILYKITR